MCLPPPPAIIVSAILTTLSLNTHAALCDANFTSNGNFITGTSYKTHADLPSVSVANAFEGALADISKEHSWKIFAQDKTKGMIQAVQTESYNKGKVIPLNINIVPVGSGAKINIYYVTPTGSLSPVNAVKSQFCQTIAAAENYASGSSANAGAVSAPSAVSSPSALGVPSRSAGLSAITPEQQKKNCKRT